MIHLELAVAFILLVFLIRRRTPIPWKADMIHVLTLAKLNRIEAAVSGVPVAEIEKNFADELDTLVAKEKGRPWFAPRLWLWPPLNK
jgi:hypothetical protein